MSDALPASQPESATPAAATGESGRSTHFDFEHRVFSVPGSYFTLLRDRDEPIFYVPMGDVMAALTFKTLSESFDIESDSHDGKLLQTAARGIRYVKEIRPGDSIPRELLDGTASWSYEERHHAVASGRLSMALLSWIAGQKMMVFTAVELEELVDDPDTRQKVQEAFAEAAEKLGLGRDGRQEVANRIEGLARELSYIEALREYFGEIRAIQGKLATLSKIHRRNPRTAEDIRRMLMLMRAPVKQYEEAFAEADERTSNMAAMLTALNRTIQYVRDTRDELHYRLSDWKDLITKWRMQPADDSPSAELTMKETYHFLAKRFQIVQSWARPS